MSNQQPGGINTAATICPPPTYLPFCPPPADGGGQAQAQGITFLNYCPQTGLPIVCPPNQAQQGQQAQPQGITFFNYCPPTHVPVFCPPVQQAQPQSTFLCTFSGSCATAPQQGQQAQAQGITFLNYCPQTGYPIVCPPNQAQQVQPAQPQSTFLCTFSGVCATAPQQGQQAQPQGITFFNYCPQTGFPTVCPPAQQGQQAQPQSTFLCTFSGSCATAPQQGQQAQPQSTFLCTFSGSCATAPQQAQPQGITFLNYCPQTGFPTVCPPDQAQQGQQAQPQSTFLCTFSGSCATAPQQGQQAQAQGITFLNYCPQTGYPIVCPPNQAQQGQPALPQSTFLCTFSGKC